MTTAVVLAGGTGTRLGGDIPKQYLMVGERPVIGYCLEVLQRHSAIDSIIVVCAPEWNGFIKECAQKCSITKFAGFTKGGRSRQHSIYNGLQLAALLGAKDEDLVIIHDAARPCISDELVQSCVDAALEADGSMPILPVKDTIYASKDGRSIDGLLCRDELFAGQAPECFKFGKYLQIHQTMDDDALAAVRGSSEIAFQRGLTIRLVPGDERNYKITTKEDYSKFCEQIMKESERHESI